MAQKANKCIDNQIAVNMYTVCLSRYFGLINKFILLRKQIKSNLVLFRNPCQYCLGKTLPYETIILPFKSSSFMQLF
jgi:hypothetical protein